MKNLFAALVFVIASSAMAGKQQVNQDGYMPTSGKTGAYYGRSDGLFQRSTGKSLYLIENGEVSQPIGTGLYEDFTVYEDGEGVVCRDESGLGACSGNAALAPFICALGDGHKFVWMPLLQQDIVPDMDAGSLDIGADQTDNDGAMLLWGLAGATGRPYVIGSDPAFYMCTTAAFADATGIDQNIMAGLVVVASGDAFNADFEALDEYAGIGILGTAAAGVTAEDITIKTETDGAATYTVNGSAPTTTAAYSFRDDVSVVPFITYLHTNDLAGEIDLYKVEVGYQE